MSLQGEYPNYILDPTVIQQIRRPISQVDPNRVYERGRSIYAEDDLDHSIVVSHKCGDDTTPYYKLTELLNSNDHIVSGLKLSISVDNTHVVVQPGVWLLNGITYNLASVSALAIDARDSTENRYDVLYVDNESTVHLISGDLSATPIEPSIPEGTLKIGSILITPTSDEITIPPPITDYVNTATDQTAKGGKTWYDQAKFQNQAIFDNRFNGYSAIFNATTGSAAEFNGYVQFNGLIDFGPQQPQFTLTNTGNLTGFIFYGDPTHLYQLVFNQSTLTFGHALTNTAFKRFLDTDDLVGGGGGTVTTISGVNTNGFTWSIANPTTTPALTLTLQNASTSQSGQLTSTDWNTFNNKQTTLGFTPEDSANKGVANGYAPLDGTTKIASAYLPSYVDDVLEVANFAALPGTGETGKIYVALDTNFEYRWSGSTYIRLVSSPGTTDALAEGVINLYFTPARVLATSLTGYTSGAGTVSASDNVLQGFQKIDGNVALKANIASPTFTSTITTPSVNINGTGGLGYINLPTQSTPPTTPSSGFHSIYANASGQMTFVGSNGFAYSLSRSLLTASHTYTFPNADGTFALASTTLSGYGIIPATTQDVTNAFNIAWWGDSLTMGGNAYVVSVPSLVQQSIGYNYYNGGVGGTTSTQIKTLMLAATDKSSWTTVIWAGQNNHNSSSTVQSDIASMVASLGHTRYVVLSVLHDSSFVSGSSDYTNITALNTALGVTYGARFLDVDATMRAASDGSAADIADTANGVVVTSCRATYNGVTDHLHLSLKGNNIVASAIVAALSNLLYTELPLTTRNIQGISVDKLSMDVADGGSYKIGSNMAIYMPSQTTYTGTIFIGTGVSGGNWNANGPLNLTHSGTNDGQYNFFGGIFTGCSITTGFRNVLITPNSSGLTSASNNTGLGYFVLPDMTTAQFNTVIGSKNGAGITTGSFNTILGGQVTGLSSSLANTVIIADGAGNQIINVGTSNTVLPANRGLFTPDNTTGAGTYRAMVVRDLPTSIPNGNLANTTISGVALGGTLSTLTTGATLTNTVGSSYNGSAATTLDVNLAHANSWTATQTFLQAGLGVTNGDGAIFSNNTAAVLGTQQNSSSTHWQGQGWNTGSSTTQSSDAIIYLTPTQGSTVTSTLNLAFAVNGGAYTVRHAFSSTGVTGFNGGTFSNKLFNTAAADVIGIQSFTTTASTVGTQQQNCPTFNLQGTVWNQTATAASNFYGWNIGARGVSGTSPSSTLFFGSGLGVSSVASYTDRMTLTSLGNLSLLTGGISLSSAGAIFNITEGTNSKVGQVTLVAGVATVTISGLTTSSRAFPGFVAQGGTSTAVYEYKMVCTTNTLTITAITIAGVTVATDTSTLNYFVIN